MGGFVTRMQVLLLTVKRHTATPEEAQSWQRLAGAGYGALVGRLVAVCLPEIHLDETV